MDLPMPDEPPVMRITLPIVYWFWNCEDTLFLLKLLYHKVARRRRKDSQSFYPEYDYLTVRNSAVDLVNLCTFFANLCEIIRQPKTKKSPYGDFM